MTSRSTLVVLALWGCGSGPGLPEQTTFGGDRPVELHVPADLDPEQPMPLLLVLHGYGINGITELAYSRLINLVDDPGVFVLAPDGTEDTEGNLYWNTGDTACLIGGPSPPDDQAYLTGLIDEVSSVWNVDPARIYVFGHSNGGFMAHRLACSDAGRYAAIISLAGAPPLDPAACVPSGPVSVLQIHGDADDTVLFAGGDQILDFTCPYPAATDTVTRWAAHDGCAELATQGEPIDLDSSLTGAETAVDRYAGCTDGATVELWTIAGGSHVPTLRNDAHLAMWAFLSAAAP